MGNNEIKSECKKGLLFMKKRLKKVKGKQILVSALAVMVIASGFYRWTAGDTDGETVAVTNDELPMEDLEPTEETSADGETDYFALTRYERDCARSEEVELLTVAAEYDEENLATAEKIEKHEKDAESEMAIENMVKSKGFEDCVAFVDDEGVKVVVKATGLEAKGVAEIKNIVMELTGVKPTAIKISNRN